MITKIKNQVYKSFGVFTKVKILENKLFNLLGVQPFRLVAAKAAGILRQMRNGIKADSPEKKTFESTGLLLLENFLKPEDFQKLKVEVDAIIQDANVPRMEKKYGPATKYTIDVMKLPEEQYPETWSFFKDERVVSLFSFAEKKPFKPKAGGARYIEILEQDEPAGTGAHDVETELHSDTFFDTNKCWLYMTDVEPQHAPLVVVPKTANVSWRRLKYEYQNSVAKKPRVSRRISEKELNESGQKEQRIICKANTFVMANTFAYHKRENGQQGNIRIALHISERSNPFKL